MSSNENVLVTVSKKGGSSLFVASLSSKKFLVCVVLPADVGLVAEDSLRGGLGIVFTLSGQKGERALPFCDLAKFILISCEAFDRTVSSTEPFQIRWEGRPLQIQVYALQSLSPLPCDGLHDELQIPAPVRW